MWPVAFDSYGRIAENSLYYIKLLVSAICKEDESQYSLIIAQVYAALSVAIMRGNHMMVVAHRGAGPPLAKQSRTRTFAADTVRPFTPTRRSPGEPLEFPFLSRKNESTTMLHARVVWRP